jgi:hypothetical protein
MHLLRISCNWFLRTIAALGAIACFLFGAAAQRALEANDPERSRPGGARARTSALANNRRVTSGHTGD